MLKKVLFISISAPHKSGPESIQVGRYLKGLSSYFTIDFVTTKPSNYGWAQKEEKGVNTLRKYTSNTIELNGYDGRFFSKLKSYLPERMKFPDNYFHTINKNIVQKTKSIPDVIYSRSGPLSATILACKVSLLNNIPWVMHLSDPWVDSPFNNTNIALNNFWEGKCFDTAKAIMVTTENYKKLLTNKYPQFKNKIHTSYNVYSDQLPLVESLSADGIKMVYAGNFYGGRSPKDILEPLSIAFSKSPKLFKNVEVAFYGNMDSKSLDLILSYKLPFIKIAGVVSHDKIAKIIEEASIVINIEEQFTPPFDGLFLPSKVIDYMASQRMILSISSKNSPSYRLVNNNFGYSFSFNEHTETANFISKALQKFNSRDTDFFKVSPLLKEYSPAFQAGKLAQILTGVINK